MPRGAGNANRDVPLFIAQGMAGEEGLTRGPVCLVQAGDQRLTGRKPIRIEWKSTVEERLPYIMGAFVPPVGVSPNSALLRMRESANSLTLPHVLNSSEGTTVIIRLGGQYVVPFDNFPDKSMLVDNDTKVGNGIIKTFTYSHGAPFETIDVHYYQTAFMFFDVEVDGVLKTYGVDYVFSASSSGALKVTFTDPPGDGLVIRLYTTGRNTELQASGLYKITGQDTGDPAVLTFANYSSVGDGSRKQFFPMIPHEMLSYGTYKVFVDGAEIQENATNGYWPFTLNIPGIVGGYNPGFLYVNLYGAALAASAGKTVAIKFYPHAGMNIEAFKVPNSHIVGLTAGRRDSNRTYDSWVMQSADFIWAVKNPTLDPAGSWQDLSIHNVNRTI